MLSEITTATTTEQSVRKNNYGKLRFVDTTKSSVGTDVRNVLE